MSRNERSRVHRTKTETQPPGRHATPGPFRGAPTRTGRMILFFFGLPFVFGGVTMLGGIFFAGSRDWIALLLGGTAFLIVGLIVWRPAFPGPVNRLLLSKHPLAVWTTRNAGRLAIYLLISIMFGTPMLIATGVIPTNDADWPAPRWVGIIAAGVFLVAGLFVLLHRRIEQLDPGLRKHIMGLFPMLIVTGMAVIADWIAFGPGERAFTTSGANGLFAVRTGGDELIGRLVFGASGVFLSVITLIGWWNYFRNRW